MRPLVTLPLVIAYFTLFALAGAPRVQLVALAIAFTALQAMFWLERTLGARRAVTELAFARSLVITTIALAIGSAASGGLASPIVPLLLAPSGIAFAAFGRARASAVILALLVASVLALIALPRGVPFPVLAAPYFEIAIVLGIVGCAVLLRLGVAALAGAHAASTGALARAGEDVAWAAVMRARDLEALGAQVAHEVKNPLAAIRGLEALKKPCRVALYTDSNYVRDGITRWIHKWRQNGWRTSDRKPVKNADLWQELVDAAAPHRIEWHWVKGHSGHPENDRVDALACAEADQQRVHHRL